MEIVFYVTGNYSGDLFKQIDYVIVGVSDMAASVKFYKNALGLPVAFESKEWSEFQTGKTKLALHPSSKKAGAPGGSDILPGSCQIGFEVPDLDQTYKELQSKGVRFAMAPKIREGEGIKLAVCLDPDGLPISLSQ